MGEPHDLSALDQAAAIRRGELSPVELTGHYLGRIERWDEALGAFVTVTADAALARAEDLQAALAGGASARPDPLPPLYGVPVPVKDLTMVAGVRTTFGSALHRDFVAPVDDHVVTLLRAAGTVMVGKTNAAEFGLPCYTETDVAPPARTPWDTIRSAGGSSGGAAAAVAGGLSPLAQGNDGGGSVRIPASVCGLVGLKVSRGRISNGPAGGDVSGLAWHGPIARTVADAAALLDVLAVPMPGDPHWAPPLPGGHTFLGALDAAPPGPARIGRFATPVLAEVTVDPECLRAYEAASNLLAELGHEVVDVDPPLSPAEIGPFEDVWASLAAAAPVPDGGEGLLRPLTRWLRERGRAIDAPRYIGAYARLQSIARDTITRWSAYDAILTPTLARPPVPVGALRDDADPAADFAAQKAFTPFTALYNVTGQPAITLPLHRSTAGLPIGVMLAGRPAGEAALLALAHGLEQAAPWREHHPECWRS